MSTSTFARFVEELGAAFTADDSRSAEKTSEARNVAALQEQYRAILRGDTAGFSEFLTDDVELEIVGSPDIPFAGQARGRQAFLEKFTANFSIIEEQHPEVSSVVAQGDLVVVAARETIRFRNHEQPKDVRWVQMFTFRDGRIARFFELLVEA